MDLTSVQKAIVESKYGPVAKEEGARLAECFISGLDRYPDSAWPTVAVESPWYLMLDSKAVLVGVQDRICVDPENNFYGNEWKSRRESKVKKDGTFYAGDTEEDWLEEISSGPQLRIYALAMQGATYLRGDQKFTLDCKKPRIIVRAVIKANPPYLWPTKPESGIFAFPDEYLWATQHGLWSAVEQIRAARKRGVIPWALPSLHCYNKYKRVCEYHTEYCHKGIHPASPVYTTKNSTDPGWASIAASGVDLADPDVVILSSSSYTNFLQCPEQYRILLSDVAPGEESMALDVGSVLHLAAAESFRQLERERG